MIDIVSVINRLSGERPVFHSEADFQHSLAWEIHKQEQNCRMRLEYKPSYFKERIYLDLFGMVDDLTFAIELKYKTRLLYTNVEDEIYLLLNQSAQDIARYDFIRDIKRLEQFCSYYKNSVGYAIFLTNDSAYWKSPLKIQPIDADFRIHQNNSITGELNWGVGASKGTIKSRENPIQLNSIYQMNWNDYSEPSNASYGRFRYLLVKTSIDM